MVEQQIRPWNVLDQRVLDLMATTPRELFVPESFRNLAFTDTHIPLGNAQIMMTPKLEARALQALEIQPSDEALEIGTGSGYLTALLACSCKQVVSVEIAVDLSKSAAEKLAARNIQNATLEVGDGVEGWASAAPYDAIAVSGSVAVLYPHFQQQLRVGGRLFVIVGEDPVMEARLITRISDSEWSSESLFETSLPPLIGAEAPDRFVL